MATTLLPALALAPLAPRLVERAWLRMAQEAVGSEGHVIPQPWLVNTIVRVPVDDRLDIVGVDPGQGICCDCT